jgi:DNA-binding NtrC family response regulator
VSSILVIDDNKAVCSALDILLSLYDLDTVSAHTPQEGLHVLESSDIDLVIQDMNFSQDTTSGEEGKQLFAAIRERYPSLPIILLTAWTHLETAVELVKQGAADYMAKPWDDDKLVITIRNLLELNRVRAALDDKLEEEAAQRETLASFDLCGTVFESGSMMQVLHLATQVADSDLPILITGPNGSGKDKVAEIIHRNSRRSGEMVRINAGAIPADLIESELFGSTSGAFTGAKDREGRFLRAHGGSLFLDEIGNLPLQGQVKLLRVLQTGEFEKLGSSETLRVDARLICATNSDLPQDMASGKFREDLYYRINVIEIKVPPLNRRPADILPLARHFLGEGKQLSAAAEMALVDYHWPGNVRELENCMQRAQLLGRQGVLEVDDLGLQPAAGSASARGKGELTAADILMALERYNGVVSRAAKSLGISRQSFYRRMQTHGLKN